MSRYAAQLRVYEPLTAVGDPAGQEVAPGWLVATEHVAAVRAAARLPPGLPDTTQALVAVVDGATLICPTDLRRRAVTALGRFRDGLHPQLADAFVPRTVADAARAERDDAPPHVLTSAWHVPVSWFLVVDAGERTVRTGDGPRRAGRALVYRTAMSAARRRVARALAVLRRTADDDGNGPSGALEVVAELGRWLEEFHPHSLVELDYGGLVDLLEDAELLQDESARDVADALAALGAGDPQRAAAAYARVVLRMKALQAVERAN